ncbi:MAG: hypothetical protein KAY50_04665 [Chitinophagaceae bacterium]|nr:hypothetical protein [Chitinophagaceae bacterium]
MKVALGLYEVIDSQFEEWKAYEPALKILFISADIEIYGKAKFNKTLYRAESVSVNMINDLLKVFATVSMTDKENLKNIYTNFIEGVCKPDKKVSVRIISEGEAERNEAYSEKDEFKAVNEIDQADEIEASDTEVFEERTMKFETLVENAKLSDIELYALNYVKDRNSKKHILLEHFTLKGIIQIANRGAYKLYYFKRKVTD